MDTRWVHMKIGHIFWDFDLVRTLGAFFKDMFLLGPVG